MWADRVAARAALPALIADLIRASATTISSFRFPHGSASQVRGFDGWLESDGFVPFVPKGKSLWEFGTSRDIRAKAEEDYQTRTTSIPPSIRSETTLVLVTPRVWDSPRQPLEVWLVEKREERKWKDVQLLDGVQLKRWCDESPAVAARFARAELEYVPVIGTRSADEFWEEYSRRFSPPLSEEVLLCDRGSQAQKLVRDFGGGPGVIFLGADSPDEVVAFAIAAIRKSELATRFFIESRLLVLDTADAARHLAAQTNRIFLLRGTAFEAAGMLAERCAVLSPIGGDRPRQEHPILDRPSFYAFGKALKSMLRDEDAAQVRSRKCGRSVTILARQIPSTTAPLPEWHARGDALIPALLAGGWDVRVRLDQQVLCTLARKRAYDEVETQLLEFKRSQDPPLDREGSVWVVRAPVDMFTYLGHRIAPEDLRNFALVAIEVFSRKQELPAPDEPLSLDRPERHSDWLRDGIAGTLLMISALHAEAGLEVIGTTPKQWVADILRKIPDLASDPRVIYSLGRELPILMEAAPDPLLEALERLLEGDPPPAKSLFLVSDSLFGPTSPHVNVLWALETIAWDPDRLDRVCCVLARLAQIDPGGRLTNRPIHTLRELFLTWHPGTNAPLQHRLATLGMIVSNYPDVGWDLMLALLPKGHDTASPTAKPRFADYAASGRETLTWRAVWESQAEVARLAYRLAGDDAARWAEIAPHVHALPRSSLDEAHEAIRTAFDRIGRDKAAPLWLALRKEVNRHRRFADTDWALPTAELDRLEDTLSDYQPEDVVDRLVWLFDSWTPFIASSDDGDEESTVERERARAIAELLKSQGEDDVLRLAARVQSPPQVAQALIAAIPEIEVALRLLTKIDFNNRQAEWFATALSRNALEKFGPAWRETLQRAVTERRISVCHAPTLLLNWPDNRATWEFAASFGPEADRAYWSAKGHWRIEGGENDLRYAIERYLGVGHAIAGLAAIQGRLGEVPQELLFGLIDESVAEVNRGRGEVNAMYKWYLEQVLGELNKREDVPTLEIARREYALLPVFRHDKRHLNIHRLMSEDPNFYFSIICDVYIPQSGDRTEVTKEAEGRARAGYELLSSFHLVPGFDGALPDEERLNSWIDRVRELAAEGDRVAITDLKLGELLAHSPHDPNDKAWPHRAIRDVLERLRSADIERGMTTERYNMRGVVSKAVFEGGDQERALADEARGWAREAAAWPRTRAMLTRIAEDWEAYAANEDMRAAHDKLRRT